MINLHRYYKDNKDDINSSIMELACDLAVARLMNEHGQPFESFVEPDDPETPTIRRAAHIIRKSFRTNSTATTTSSTTVSPV